MQEKTNNSPIDNSKLLNKKAPLYFLISVASSQLLSLVLGFLVSQKINYDFFVVGTIVPAIIFPLIHLSHLKFTRKMDIILEKNRLLTIKLFDSRKFSSLGKMAGSLAHEINNPLTIISFQVQKLKRELKTKEDQDRFVKIQDLLMGQINRISKITKALRVFAKDGITSNKELLDIKFVLLNSIETLRSEFEINKIQCN